MNKVLFLLFLIILSCKKGDNLSVVEKGVKDYDGNVYDTINIGTQTWMKENLKTTKYKDGTAIPIVKDNTAWYNLTTPGYCWYDNNETSYKNTYGALYNWYAVNTGILCPTGWHVPSETEWDTLVNYLGGRNIAGGKLKESGTAHWTSSNINVTNESGFTALPGGLRETNGQFNNNGTYGYWWSSTVHPSFPPSGGALTMWIQLSNFLEMPGYNSKYGFSIRCIKD